MGKEYKVLGQTAPSANEAVKLYSVPIGKQTVISTIMVCNRDLRVIGSYDIAIVPNGETLNEVHFIRVNKLLDARSDHSMTLGISLSDQSSLWVRATTNAFSFSAFGVEIG